MEEHKVTLGGRERTFRYTPKDRMAIEQALFGGSKDIVELIGISTLQVQATIIWGGLRHEQKKLDVDTVIDWVEEYLTTTGPISDLTHEAVRALGEGRACGWKFTLDADGKLRALEGKEERGSA